MNIKVEVYNTVKYSPESEIIAEVEYTNIKGIEIKNLEDQEVYEMGFVEVDENQEYCIVTFENGDISTFRNSHIDVFKI